MHMHHAQTHPPLLQIRSVFLFHDLFTLSASQPSVVHLLGVKVTDPVAPSFCLHPVFQLRLMSQSQKWTQFSNQRNNVIEHRGLILISKLETLLFRNIYHAVGHVAQLCLFTRGSIQSAWTPPLQGYSAPDASANQLHFMFTVSHVALWSPVNPVRLELLTPVMLLKKQRKPAVRQRREMHFRSSKEDICFSAL